MTIYSNLMGISDNFKEMTAKSMALTGIDKIHPFLEALYETAVKEMTDKNPIEQVSPLFMSGLGNFAVAHANHDHKTPTNISTKNHSINIGPQGGRFA